MEWEEPEAEWKDLEHCCSPYRKEAVAQAAGWVIVILAIMN